MNGCPLRTEFFTVRHGETDREARLRLDVWFEYMQEIAANHAAALGFGLRDLASKKMIWVLSRLRMRMFRTPCVGTKIRLETMPSGVDKIFALREFRFLDESSGEVLAVASSAWLILDSETGRPKRPRETLPGVFPENGACEIHFPDLGKLRPAGGGDKLEIPVRESMIDVNRHLNNARAVAVVYDWLSSAVRGTPVVSEFRINFSAASKTGELLEISGASGENGVFSAECSANGTLRFLADGVIS